MGASNLVAASLVCVSKNLLIILMWYLFYFANLNFLNKFIYNVLSYIDMVFNFLGVWELESL